MLSDYKGPDLNAPRYRKTAVNLMNQETFKRFVEKYPEHKDKTYEEFKRNINIFNEALWKTAIEHRDGIELPENLGNIFIATCKRTKRKNINFGESAKYKKTVTNQNHETDGKNCKIFYTNYDNKYKFMNRIMWMFQGSRDFKREVANTYPQDWKKYIEVDPNAKINRLYKKRMNQDYMERQQNNILDFYNEFDMD